MAVAAGVVRKKVVLTSKDLVQIVAHYAKWIIATSMACALLLGGYSYVAGSAKTQSYTTRSTLTVTDTTGLLNSTSLLNLTTAIASNEADLAKQQGVSVSIEADSITQSITFSASATSEEASVDLANDIAGQTAESAEEALLEQSNAYLNAVKEDSSMVENGLESATGATAAERAAALRSCLFTIQPAYSAAENGTTGVGKYAVAGLAAGFLLAVCMFVLKCAVRRPVKGRFDVACVADIPVLVEGNNMRAGELLWSSLYFAKEDAPESVCILPISGGSRSDIASMMEQAMQKLKNTNSEGTPSVMIRNCASLEESAWGIQAARGSDIVILVVHSWVDSVVDLQETVSHLQNAGVRVGGVILV